jgi:S-adenosylmethionine:tRNA ribosyltransferase-isomerase
LTVNTEDFDYDLPERLIAQEPAPRRDGSRLLVVDRAGAPPADHRFGELADLLPTDALLVFNDSRVFPARLRGHKPTGGGVEVLLVSPRPATDGPEEPEEPPHACVWRCLCRSSKGLTLGGEIRFGDDDDNPTVVAEVLGVLSDGSADLAFRRPGEASPQSPDWLLAWATEVGETPLPPYIRRPDGEQALDRERYQTVYAREKGSVAAPTAGLHFTLGLLERLAQRGMELAYLTLHVGPGTFRPVRADRIDEHRMDAERVEVTPALVDKVSRAKSAGRPVVAVGTTTVRALEGMASSPGRLEAGTREVSLFITPGYEFRIVDRLITNFHLPRSTLLMLVSALAGRDRVLAAYRHAVGEGYRFYSYGDAMLIR